MLLIFLSNLSTGKPSEAGGEVWYYLASIYIDDSNDSTWVHDFLTADNKGWVYNDRVGVRSNRFNRQETSEAL